MLKQIPIGNNTENVSTITGSSSLSFISFKNFIKTLDDWSCSVGKAKEFDRKLLRLEDFDLLSLPQFDAINLKAVKSGLGFWLGNDAILSEPEAQKWRKKLRRSFGEKVYVKSGTGRLFVSSYELWRYSEKRLLISADTNKDTSASMVVVLNPKEEPESEIGNIMRPPEDCSISIRLRTGSGYTLDNVLDVTLNPPEKAEKDVAEKKGG